MKTEIWDISPAMAGSLLLNNTRNRPLRETHVLKLAGAMERGEWQLTHQGIAINADGSTSDGQHRLHAIVKSGVTVRMMVTTGIVDSAFRVIDGGIGRTLSDLSGIKKSHVEVLTFFVVSAGTKSPTLAQILKMDATIGDHVHALHDYCGSTTKVTSRVGIKSAAVLHSIVGNRDYAYALYRDLVLDKIEALPPVAMEFVRQRLKGTLIGTTSGGQAQVTVFTKAVSLFDPKNRESRRLIYSDDKRIGAIEKLNNALIAIGKT